MKAKLAAAFAAIMTIIFCLPVHAAEGVIQQIYVDPTGKAEVIGYFDDTEQTDTTFLMTDTDNMDTVMAAPNDHIMYIDQSPMGNNGTFYYHFQISEKYSESPYVLRMNGGTLIEQTGTLGEIPSAIYNIADNAIRVGNDVYDVGCEYYIPDNISKSIERGGNKIYYKIGGRWFDMLNENANSWDYFTETNAIPEAEWSTWNINIYYHY